MAAKDKDAFYEKLGFISRPNDIFGPGMIKRFLVEDKEKQEQALMYLYHYYEKTSQPFLNLSDLSIEEANQVLENIKKIFDTYFEVKSVDINM